jgi:hypothetical protein
LGNFLKITEVAQILGPVFPQCKSCIKFLNVMGDFIKKPSDHPVQCLKDWNMERFCPTSGIYFRSFQAHCGAQMDTRRLCNELDSQLKREPTYIRDETTIEILELEQVSFSPVQQIFF